MAKPPPNHRRPLNIFRDDQLAPESLQNAFAEATRIGAAAVPVAPPTAPLDGSPTSTAQQSLLPSAVPQAAPETLVAGATAPSGARETPSRPAKNSPLLTSQRLPEKNVGIEIRIPQLTRSEFMSFKARFGAALGGVALTDSHIVRALFECLLVQDADYVIEVAEEQSRPIKRPANQDLMAQAEFDALLAGIFREGQQRSRRRRTVRADDGASA
jgi:hypothetical protein